MSSTLTSSMGKPASTPVSMASTMPACDRRDVFLGNGPADDLVLEGEARAVLVGLHLDDHVAVLAAAAGLADEAALGLGHRLGDALAVGHLRPAHVGVDLELAQQPVDDDLQMQLAHAGDDGLARSPRRCARGRSGPPRPAS